MVWLLILCHRRTDGLSLHICFLFRFIKNAWSARHIRCHEPYVRRMLHEGQIQTFSNSKCSIAASEPFIIRNIPDSCMAISGIFWKYKGKGKGTYPCPSQEGVGENRGIAPLIFSFGTGWEWTVNFTPQPLYPRNEPRSHWGWVDLITGLDFSWKRENLSLTWIRAPELPVRSVVAIPTTLLQFLLKVYSMIISYVRMILQSVRCYLTHFNTYFMCGFHCCNSIIRMY